MAAEQMIALVLERCAGQPEAADWRMLADILATRRELSHRAAARAEAVLTAGHARMPAETRVEVARAIGPGCRSAGLVGLFCRGTLGEAMPLLTGATLDAASWEALLPTLRPQHRAALRQRADLPAAVRRALDSFGPADLGLPAPPVAAAPVRAADPARPLSPIAALVQRIADHQARKGQRHAVELPDRFQVEFDTDGRVVWSSVQGHAGLADARLTLAVDDGAGVDAGVVRSLGERRPIRGRWRIPDGEGSFVGELAAAPIPDPRGRVQGFRGTVTRCPDQAEIADVDSIVAEDFAGLRDALHAIRLCTATLRSPALAPHDVGQEAAAIDGQVDRIAGIADRIALETGRPASAPNLHRLCEELDGRARARGASLRLAPVGAGLHDVTGTELRMLRQLLGALIPLTSRGDALLVTAGEGHRGRWITASLPVALGALVRGDAPATAPLDGALSRPAMEAPLLSLDFALRLAERVLGAGGGAGLVDGLLTIRFAAPVPALATSQAPL